jgi:sugar phosphate isomerase/epimerase
MKYLPRVLSLLVCALTARASAGTWSLENQYAWSVIPYDGVRRAPEERAEMFKRLGLQKYAYSWREAQIPTFEQEIEAMKKHGIEIIAWNFLSVEIDDPAAKAALEAFKRQGVRPQLWIMQSPSNRPRKYQDWLKYVSPGVKVPPTQADVDALPAPERAKVTAELQKARIRYRQESLPRTPEELRAKVAGEVTRIKHIVEVASAYGCTVALYPHNSWFGVPDNLVTIIEQLRAQGVSGVGMVYNFHHARDENHDDTKDFPALWSRIKAHVVAITITGLRFEGEFCYPSQGDSEVAMMRTIQESGWRGHVGLTAEMGGDAEVTLRNYQRGIKWIESELTRPGSGGPRPFPTLQPFVPKQ